MTWVLKVRGAHSQPALLDFACPNCGPFSAMADRDCEGTLCIDDCGAIAERIISAPFVGPEKATVDRGPVQRAENPKWLDTRALAEGMPLSEFRAMRAKRQEERRQAESREFGRFVKGTK